MNAKVYYVVRTKRSGKFVRAFNNESQAVSWCERHSQWRYAAETMSAPDANGNVFALNA